MNASKQLNLSKRNSESTQIRQVPSETCSLLLLIAVANTIPHYIKSANEIYPNGTSKSMKYEPSSLNYYHYRIPLMGSNQSGQSNKTNNKIEGDGEKQKYGSSDLLEHCVYI